MDDYKICVIGLGYVGLPLARLFSTKYCTIGFDIDSKRVGALNNGNDSTLEEPSELLHDARGFRCTTEIDEIRDFNFYIVTVSTPVDSNNYLDLEPLINASRIVGKVISKGDIVVYESTVYTRVTEECLPIIEKVSGLRYNIDFFAEYSPVRINSEDKEHTIEKKEKVTPGSTPEIAERVDHVYNSVLVNGAYRASMTASVLRITTEINRGSIGRTTEQLGKLVISNNWKSYIAYGRTGGKSDSEVIKIGNKLDVYSHVFLTRAFDLHGRGSIRATKSFISKINSLKPDIIHLHSIHGYYVNYEILFDFLVKYDRPVVWTQHDCWAYTGHCAHYTEIGCDKWKNVCYHCPQKLSYPKSLFRDHSRRNFIDKKKSFTSVNNMTIVAVSEWMKAQIKESFLNKYPIIKIYNGVDTKIFFPHKNVEYIRQKYSIGDGQILMGMATTWTERKGLSDYYKLRSMLDNSYVIVLVGLPQSMISALPKGIIGIERTDNVEELAELYSIASIILNLSREESFGKTTVEGLSCGTPGIVYDTTASPELVDDSTGRVVRKGDIELVVKSIFELSALDKEEMLLNCRNRAMNLFDIEKNFNEYIDLYKLLIH